jgi:hypothetical protein
MDVRAIVLFPAVNEAESLGGVPLPLLDVLGRPVLHRITERLYQAGVTAIRIIGDAGPHSSRFLRRALHGNDQFEHASGSALWRVALRAFSELTQSGADLVLILRTGPYVEMDLDRLIQIHLDQNSRVTAVTDSGRELLGAFLLSATRRNDAAFLLRHDLAECRSPYLEYATGGYVNRLASAADLRRLAVDAFCGRAAIRPVGTEIKPGVWAAASARIHRGARLLAPAFIGEHARVRASAVITRCSTLEHHTEVDCGTIVEDTSILPYTSVGAGLDVAHSVVGLRKVHHLRRMVEVEVSDPRLVGTVAAAPVRMLNQVAALAGFLPASFLRGFFGRSKHQPGLPDTAQSPVTTMETSRSLPETDPALSNFR